MILVRCVSGGAPLSASSEDAGAIPPSPLPPKPVLDDGSTVDGSLSRDAGARVEAAFCDTFSGAFCSDFERGVFPQPWDLKSVGDGSVVLWDDASVPSGPTRNQNAMRTTASSGTNTSAQAFGASGIHPRWRITFDVQVANIAPDAGVGTIAVLESLDSNAGLRLAMQSAGSGVVTVVDTGGDQSPAKRFTGLTLLTGEWTHVVWTLDLIAHTASIRGGTSPEAPRPLKPEWDKTAPFQLGLGPDYGSGDRSLRFDNVTVEAF
jgi:hypothetical protein